MYCQHLVLSQLFWGPTLTGMQQSATAILLCIPLMASDIEHLPVHLFATAYPFSERSVHVFAYFLTRLFDIFYCTFICIFLMPGFSQIRDAQIFSPFLICCLFILFPGTSAEKKV